MKKFRKYIFLFPLFCGLLHSETPEEIFSRANELFKAGNYLDAIKEYESIIASGYVSYELYYNLGNAYYRNGQLGKAILNYERAAVLNPREPDVQHNLKLCYLKTVDRIESVPELFFIQWLRVIASLLLPETVLYSFLSAWILLFLSLAIMYVTRKENILRILKVMFAVSLIFVILSLLMMGIQTFRETTKDKGIIVDKVVTAKTSPDSKSIDAFVIHEGLKVKIGDMVDNWVKIILPDGKVGWVYSYQCERI